MHLGGGPSFPRAAMRDFVNNGFHFGGGGGVNLTREFGLAGEFRFNSFGVNDETLRRRIRRCGLIPTRERVDMT